MRVNICRIDVRNMVGRLRIVYSSEKEVADCLSKVVGDRVFLILIIRIMLKIKRKQ